jgi:hypothetical protein
MFEPDGSDSDIWPGDTVTVAGATFRKNADDTYDLLVTQKEAIS